MAALEIFCGLVVVLAIFYYYLVATYDFWKKRGIPGPEPLPIFGTMMPVMTTKMSVSDFFLKVSQEYRDEPIFGMFIRRRPTLCIHDPELIKTVLIKDFNKFSDRGLRFNAVAEPLSQHLFALETKRWRPLRMKFSPIFTSGKLKEMFTLILECSDTLVKYLDTLVAKGGPIDIRELTGRFTTDVIGSCAFGLNMNAMSEEDNTFRKLGKEFVSADWKQRWRLRIREATPWLYTILGYILPEDPMIKYFIKIVFDTMEYRRKNNIVRLDFINTLMELQADSTKINDIVLTESLIASQAFVFFVAGFETSSTTISNALYELAINQDIQNLLREEIKEHSLQHNGAWLYENVKQMSTLDKVFKETLRKYPPLPFLMREAMEDYTFEDIKLSIPKGTRVFIPIISLHRNSRIYPDPDTFNINRFDQEAIAARNQMYYLPFGDGPRNCIGARFAVFQTKIALIKILNEYKVDVCEKTEIPYQIMLGALLLTPKNGIYLNVTKL